MKEDTITMIIGVSIILNVMLALIVITNFGNLDGEKTLATFIIESDFYPVCYLTNNGYPGCGEKEENKEEYKYKTITISSGWYAGQVIYLRNVENHATWILNDSSKGLGVLGCTSVNKRGEIMQTYVLDYGYSCEDYGLKDYGEQEMYCREKRMLDNCFKNKKPYGICVSYGYHWSRSYNCTNFMVVEEVNKNG